MREDETITDQGDDFEVYERKKPRPEVRPGSVPDVSRGGTRSAGPPAEDAPADPDDGAWLMSDPTSATRSEAASTMDTEHLAPEAADAAPTGVLGGLFGGDAPAREDAAALPDVMDLPDPPAVPMRVQDDVPAPRTAAAVPAPPASTTAPSPPPPTAPSSSSTPSSTPRSTSNRGETMRIAIAATEFNYDITHMMIERARAHAEFLGATIEHIVRVPGVYDLPLAVKRLLGRSDVDAVATLGVVIEGETDHDDLVIQHAARKIIDLSLEHDKPVGLGITGPGMSRLQAEARIDRAKDAVEACVKLHRTLAAY